jgi:cytochrome b subunit of formate dehydrogenase
MQNILHWIAVALAFLVVIGGMRMFVRGLSQSRAIPRRACASTGKTGGARSLPGNRA